MHRYQLDSRGVTVKRRLFHGQPASGIISVVQFAPSPNDGWIPFHVRASDSAIEYWFAGHIARLPGPLDTDGANKIAIAPGTRLRNLRLLVEGPDAGSAGRFGAVSVPGAVDAAQAEPAPPNQAHGQLVPDGEYTVNLEWWRQKQTLRLKVNAGELEVLESTEPKLEGVTGRFRPGNEGGAYIFLQSPQEGLGGQVWRRQADGSFDIKEIPDRGENQRAVLTPRK
jgi:hypothetical protein